MSLSRGMGRCYLCESWEALERHHMDWHHENNSPSNRVLLCHRCHTELHKVGYLSLQELDGIRDKVRGGLNGGA